MLEISKISLHSTVQYIVHFSSDQKRYLIDCSNNYRYTRNHSYIANNYYKTIRRSIHYYRFFRFYLNRFIFENRPSLARTTLFWGDHLVRILESVSRRSVFKLTSAYFAKRFGPPATVCVTSSLANGIKIRKSNT